MFIFAPSQNRPTMIRADGRAQASGIISAAHAAGRLDWFVRKSSLTHGGAERPAGARLKLLARRAPETMGAGPTLRGPYFFCRPLLVSAPSFSPLFAPIVTDSSR